MRRFLAIGSLILALLGVSCAADRTDPLEPLCLCDDPPLHPGASGRMILIKADDLTHDWDRPDRIHPRWERFFETIRCSGIRASAGVIGRSVATGGAGYRDILKRLHASGFIELFNHGFTHSLEGADPSWHAGAEFLGTPPAFQILRLQATQDLLESVLGAEPVAFGAPGNAWDDATAKALEAAPGLKFWFFGRAAPRVETVAASLRIEDPTTRRPEISLFRRSFKAGEEAIILQVHPAAWSQPEDWTVFQQVIDSLKATGAQFVTPREYLERKRSTLDRRIGVGE